MSPPCLNCGFANPPGMRFCGQCGTRLTEVTAASPGTITPEQLGVMMGPDLLERFRRAGLEAAGQRRAVTVLFADLAGYTDLSERMDPEELFTLIQQFISLLAQNVYKYEGAVDKFTGDGLMALFGAPIAQENNAEMAVRAAWDMQADMARFATTIRERLGREVHLHIGLHSGPVIVGSIGSNWLMNYTAIGDTVNLARRLQEASQPGAIVASEAVYEQTRAVYDFTPLPALALKGITRPVAAYRVVGPKDQPGSPRGLEGLRAPMVGRAAELRQLQSIVSGLTHEAQGHFVLITGEAGMGKSRLVLELKQNLAVNTVQVFEGHSLTYRRTAAYWMFIDLLRRALGITAYTPEAEVRARLAQRVGDGLGPLATEALPYLEHLLALRPADAGAAARIEALDAGQLRQQLFLAMREWLVAEAQRCPAVLVLEDLHWADDVSWDLLLSLVDSLRQVPLAIIALSRPMPEGRLSSLSEQVHKRLGERFRHLELQSLSTVESEQLLLQLTAIPDLPEAVRQSIVQRAAGIPFYLEEILRMLIDAGTLRHEGGAWRLTAGAEVQALGVPDNLQGLILARFDRLSAPQRRALQVAAVIGRQFSRAMLTAVLRLADGHPGGIEAGQLADDALDRTLQPLVQREFIVPVIDAPAGEYQFKHVLVSDAIYSTLLRRDRSELHGVVGEAIERLYADRLEDQIEVLARHYAWSPRLDRALHYSLLAGQKAARGYAVEQARRHFEQALSLLPQVPHSAAQVVEAHQGLGDALLFVGDYEAAREQFRAGLAALAREADSRQADARSRLQRRLSRTFERQGDHEAALLSLAAAQQALEESSAPQPVEKAHILHDIGWIHFRQGKTGLAQQYLQAALELVEGTNAFDVIASIYNRLGGLAYSQGDWTSCANYVRKSIAIRESIADVGSLANSFNNLGVLEVEMGQFGSALENLTRSYELKLRQGQADGLAVALNNLGLLRLRRGELPEARAALCEALEIAQQIGYTSLLGSVFKHLGEMHLAAQEWPQAREALSQGIDLFREIGVQDQLLEMYQLMGEGSLEFENVDTARVWALKAETAYASLGERASRLSDIQRSEFLRFRARLAIEEGDWVTAQRLLRESEEAIRSVGNRLFQGRIAREFGLLAARQGEPQRAQLYYREAGLLFRSVGARLEAKHAEELLAKLLLR